MIDRVFWLCVVFLHWLAARFKTTYEVVNVWIFCVIWPVFTLALIVLLMWQGFRIAALKH